VLWFADIEWAIFLNHDGLSFSLWLAGVAIAAAFASAAAGGRLRLLPLILVAIFAVTVAAFTVMPWDDEAEGGAGLILLWAILAIGAGEVIDYANEDFTPNGEIYDVIFDAAGKTTFLHCRGSLKPGGIYITTDPGFMWQDLPFALVSKRAKIGFVRYTSQTS
jgi:hypothetical protein